MLTKDVAKMHFDASHDYKVGDTLPTPALSVDMKPLEGIVISIKKELEAMQMYTQTGQAVKRRRDAAALLPTGKHGTGSQGPARGPLHQHGVP